MLLVMNEISLDFPLRHPRQDRSSLTVKLLGLHSLWANLADLRHQVDPELESLVDLDYSILNLSALEQKASPTPGFMKHIPEFLADAGQITDRGVKLVKFGSDWPQMGQIKDFLRPVESKCAEIRFEKVPDLSNEQKSTEIWTEKSQIRLIWGQSDPL